MNLLTISIINSCNYSCTYCPVLKWLVPIDTDRTDVNMLTNEAIINWLKSWASPDEWFIEITGGEPALYKDLDGLISELSEMGYHGVIKTNGSLPIVQSDNFPLISAWHKGNSFPLFYDKILIIENPDDDWQKKVRYCIENKFPYNTVKFSENNADKGGGCEIQCFDRCLHLNSSGQFTLCSRMKVDPENNIFNGVIPKETMKPCIKCKNITDTEKFMEGI